MAGFAAVRQAEMVAMATVSTTVNFVSQYQHELHTVSDNEEAGEPPPPVNNEFIGDTNHLTTISLPSDEAWMNATAKDHGLHLVMEVVRSGEPLDLDKKKLRKKCLLPVLYIKH